MSEQKKRELSAGERFRVLKMTLESVFFQTEAFSEKDRARPKMTKGLIGVLVLAAAQLLLLSFWVWRDARPLTPKEMTAVNAVAEYSRLWQAGDLGGMFTSFKSEGGKPESPLYYWLAVPAVRFIPAAPEKAIILFNSFYLGLIALFTFLLVRYNRVDKSGWLAACFATCLPFVLGSAKIISPEIAVIAWTIGCYAAFIWSEEFEKPKPTYAFGLCFMFGMLTSWAFPLYILPISLYFVNGLLNGISRKTCFNILLLNAAVFIVWLWINLPAVAMWSFTTAALPAEGPQLSSLGKVTWHFWQAFNSAGFIMFGIGVLSFIWMMTAEFMPFPGRRALFNWMLVTYIALIFIPVREPRLYWPALVALAPAAGIMMPKQGRWVLLGICAFVALSVQTGFVNAKKITLAGHPITVIGSESAALRDAGVAKMLDAGKQYLPQTAPLNTAVVVKPSANINAAWLSAQARSAGFGKLIFINDSDSVFKYPELVVWLAGVQTSSAAEKDETVFASANPADAQNWFSQLYAPAGRFAIKDPVNGTEAQAYLFGLKRSTAAPYTEGVVPLGDLKLGRAELTEVKFAPGEWDAEAGCYKTAHLGAGVLRDGTVDIYGPVVELKNFSFVADNGNLRITRLDAVLVKKAIVNATSLQDCLDSWFGGGGKESSVQIAPEGISAAFDYKGYPVSVLVGMAVPAEGAGPEFTVRRLTLRGISVPSFMASTQKFSPDLRPSPKLPFSVTLAPTFLYNGNIKTGFKPPQPDGGEE